MRILIFVVAALTCAQAQAAALRTVTTLHGPNVFLHDLFDNAGPNADRLLGPGPGPGGRIIVEAAQLNAIARQYDVAWRSVSSADRSVLEWPGRPLRKAEIIDTVRAAVAATGSADDIGVDLSGFNAPIVPSDAAFSPAVSQLDYDMNSGRFTAALTITGEGMNPIDTRISGRIEQMVQAPVTLTRVLPGAILRPEDVHMARVQATAAQNEIAQSLDQIVGMGVRRPVAAGQPLRLADLVRPPMVRRGSMVQIELSSSGLSVIGQVIALDAGAEGERVRVQNTNSHALLFAEVVGPGQVRVMPDAPAASTTPPGAVERVRADIQ